MVQHLGTRVQKLERSKGQISKDLCEMLRESYEMNRRLDSEKGGGVATSPRKGVAPSEHKSEEDVPASAASDKAIAPPPGLAADISAPPLQRLKTAPPSEQTTARRAEGLPMPLPEALQVQETVADNGDIVYMVKWRIDNVKSKFKDCIGRPLVSPQFEAGELAELRLMVFPNIGIDSSSTMRDQKARFEAVIAEGPLKGALKFKVVGGQGVERLLIDFSLFVGGAKQGPMQHNFAEHIIKGCDFNNNWLQEMDHGALTVGVEILKINSPLQPVPQVPAGDASDEGEVEVVDIRE